MGARLRIEWARNSKGEYPAQDILDTLPAKEKAAFLERFRRLANHGKIINREHFKKIGSELFEFKRYQTRFFGDFRSDQRFLISHGVTNKKKDRVREQDKTKARRVLQEHNEFEKKGRNR